MKQFRLLSFLLLLNSYSVLATHIVGGEMNYRHLGGNIYEIRLTLYRDCFNGVPPFDDPASVGIYNSSNQLVNLTYNYTGFYPGNSSTYYNNATFNNQTYGYLIHPHDSQPVPNVISDPCVVPPTNICYSVCHYIDTVYLPPIPGGYHLIYQRCCRNFSISNIVNPLDVGATYDAWIPPVPYDDDSNPVFNAWPPTYICVNEPFTFDHSATDYEGDSLVYQLCDPVDGPNNPCWYDNLCCTTTPQPCGPMPQPPYDPPYINVIWNPPYSLANVFGGVPLSIDPQTGWLTATPNMVGQYVYAVCVIEYRNGIPISQTRRDFQVNIVVCANITVSSILSPTITCGLNVAAFTNNSTGASSYFWNFGDSTTLADTSNLFEPNYIYPDTGWYNVMLIAYSSVNPACDDTSYGNVYVYPQLTSGFSFQVLPCTRTVVFTDSASTQSGTPNSWFWDFGDGNTSAQQAPVHTYLNNGNYQVTLITQTNMGCADTITMTVPVNYFPVSSAFTYSNVSCTYDFNFTNQSANATSYSWNFGDAFTSATVNPSHTYASSGNYTVTLIANDTNGCGDTTIQIVSMQPLAQANFIYQVDTCSLTVTFTNNSANANSYSWDFGDASGSSAANPVHTYASSGNYNVTLIATTTAGCDDTTAGPVSLSITLPAAAFTINQSQCSFSIGLNNQSTGANNYSWDFGDFTSSSQQNPSHTYSAPGNYTITLIISGVASCADTVSQSIIVSPLPSAAFNALPDICSLTSVFNDNSLNATSYSWNFGDATTSSQQNPSHTYAAAGSYTVTLTVTDVNGCTSSATQVVSYSPLPVSAFSLQVDICSHLVTFINSSVNAVSYLWDFGDATTSSVPNPTHLYASNGNYNVTLVTTSLNGCTDTLVIPVTVNYNPVIAAFNVVNTACSFYVSFTNQSSNGTNYYWNFGDSYFSSQQNPNHIYSAPGNYIITLITTDALGCGDTVSQNIVLPAPAMAAFSFAADSCTRLVSFTNNSVNGNSYYWDFGDATSSSQVNPTHTYTANGNYNVSLITTSPSGCTDTVVIPVPVTITLPIAAFTPATSLCNYDVNFTNQSVNASSYTWDFGDNSYSTVPNPTHTYLNPGSYTITLLVSTAAGCLDSTANNVGVAALPVASFTPQVDTCSLIAHFLNTSQNAVNFYWNFGDSTTSTSGTPGAHTYPATGTYNVMLVVEDNNGCRDTLTKTVNPYILSQADYTYAIDTCAQEVNFFNQSDVALSYFWDFGDGQTSTKASDIHHYSSDGHYPVLLITNPGTACADTAGYTVDFSMVGIGNIWVPNAFTPNSDGKNDIFEVVGYYPCEELTLYIFNRWGELVYKTTGTHITWDGNYFDQRVELEVFVYILQGTYYYQKGHITVIR